MVQIFGLLLTPYNCGLQQTPNLPATVSRSLGVVGLQKGTSEALFNVKTDSYIP
jgi:hypothetical protein